MIQSDACNETLCMALKEGAFAWIRGGEIDGIATGENPVPGQQQLTWIADHDSRPSRI